MNRTRSIELTVHALLSWLGRDVWIQFSDLTFRVLSLNDLNYFLISYRINSFIYCQSKHTQQQRYVSFEAENNSYLCLLNWHYSIVFFSSLLVLSFRFSFRTYYFADAKQSTVGTGEIQLFSFFYGFCTFFAKKANRATETNGETKIVWSAPAPAWHTLHIWTRKKNIMSAFDLFARNAQREHLCIAPAKPVNYEIYSLFAKFDSAEEYPFFWKLL